MHGVGDGYIDIEQAQSGDETTHDSIGCDGCDLRKIVKQVIFIPEVHPRQHNDEQANIEPHDDAQK